MPFSTEFISGEQIELSVYQAYEKLKNNFEIHAGHAIPADMYTFWRYTLSGSTAQRRNVWASFMVDGGDFYSGKRTQYLAEMSYKIGVPLLLGGEYQHNDVSLLTGDFQTDVYRLNMNILFSPEIFLYNFLQYDNLTKKMGWQSRFVWILKPGREIFLVWKSVSQDPFERFEITENSTRLKLKYTIRF